MVRHSHQDALSESEFDQLVGATDELEKPYDAECLFVLVAAGRLGTKYSSCTRRCSRRGTNGRFRLMSSTEPQHADSLPNTDSYRILESVRTRLSADVLENFVARLEVALDSFPELVDETVTVACRARPEADYSQWDPYASADPVNRLIRIPTDSHVTNVTLWHELGYLAIRIQDERGEDVPVTSEEYCSLFSVARMPGTAIDEWRIPYLGKPRKRQSRWPEIAERSLEYRENHQDYIQTAKTWYSIGSEYDHLADPWDEREVDDGGE